jgi:hypothetical protein
MSRQFAIERDRGTRGAFLLEFLNSAGPTPEQLAVSKWGVGRSVAPACQGRVRPVARHPRIRGAILPTPQDAAPCASASAYTWSNCQIVSARSRSIRGPTTTSTTQHLTCTVVSVGTSVEPSTMPGQSRARSWLQWDLQIYDRAVSPSPHIRLARIGWARIPGEAWSTPTSAPTISPTCTSWAVVASSPPAPRPRPSPSWRWPSAPPSTSPRDSEQGTYENINLSRH